jgi:hypothetical protein
VSGVAEEIDKSHIGFADTKTVDGRPIRANENPLLLPLKGDPRIFPRPDEVLSLQNRCRLCSRHSAQISNVGKGVFLSTTKAAQDKDALAKLGITRVLRCVGRDHAAEATPQPGSHVYAQSLTVMLDDADPKLHEQLAMAASFVGRGGMILIHCEFSLVLVLRPRSRYWGDMMQARMASRAAWRLCWPPGWSNGTTGCGCWRSFCRCRSTVGLWRRAWLFAARSPTSNRSISNPRLGPGLGAWTKPAFTFPS